MLINSCGFQLSQGQRVELPWQWRLFLGNLGAVAMRGMNLLIRSGLPRLARRELPPDVLEGYRYPFRDPDSRAAMLEFARMSASRLLTSDWQILDEIVSKLKSISAPVDILWGKRDPILRSRLLPYLLRDAFPNAAEPLFLEQASHLVPEDAPEVLADKLLEPFRPKPKKAQPLFNILK